MKESKILKMLVKEIASHTSRPRRRRKENNSCPASITQSMISLQSSPRQRKWPITHSDRSLQRKKLRCCAAVLTLLLNCANFHQSSQNLTWTPKKRLHTATLSKNQMHKRASRAYLWSLRSSRWPTSSKKIQTTSGRLPLLGLRTSAGSMAASSSTMKHIINMPRRPSHRQLDCRIRVRIGKQIYALINRACQYFTKRMSIQ